MDAHAEFSLQPVDYVEFLWFDLGPFIMLEKFSLPTRLMDRAKPVWLGGLLSSTVHAFTLSLLAACDADCSGEKKGHPFNGVEIQERFQAEGFPGLAKELRPYMEGMNAANAQYFDRVLDLMEANLNGVEVKRSTFSENPKVRAVASIPRDYKDPTLPKMTLNENWIPNNGIDLAIAVHELGHIADLLDSKTTLDESTWTKIYGAPGKAIEVRTELKAWELHLVLLNQLSGGLLDEFYKEVNKVASSEQADFVLTTYTERIAKELNVREDQKGVLKRLLEIYFNYKAPNRFGIDCRWAYDFVVQVAYEYYKQDFHLYELDLKAEDQKSDPTRCIDPLPEGPYNYQSYRPYEQLRPGTAGPSAEAMPFNR